MEWLTIPIAPHYIFASIGGTIGTTGTAVVIIALTEKGKTMRLIDADALIDELGISDEDIIFEEMLVDAPTIYAEPHWIPCEERLPEEEGWYLVTIQNDKTEKRRTENDLFAIGIAEAHKLTPYKFCKDGHRQTVIAWMPLPKPWKGSDNE